MIISREGARLSALGGGWDVPVTWNSDRDEKELMRWKKVWRERAVWSEPRGPPRLSSPCRVLCAASMAGHGRSLGTSDGQRNPLAQVFQSPSSPMIIDGHETRGPATAFMRAVRPIGGHNLPGIGMSKLTNARCSRRQCRAPRCRSHQTRYRPRLKPSNAAPFVKGCGRHDTTATYACAPRALMRRSARCLVR